jgi:cytochrome b involved in lipid metabolism
MEEARKDAELMPPPLKLTSLAINSFPAVNSNQRASIGLTRQKQPLAQGHSPMDWAALKISGKSLTGGLTQLKRYSPEELLKHNKKDDLWMAFRGKVYNVTPYIDYHPGGVGQLMRGAGKDITELVMKIHPWVNVEVMLDKCFIGYFVRESLV